MDPNHFDTLVRALFTTPSRRVVTRALAGLSAGSLIAPLLDLSDAEAKKRGRRRKKRDKKNKNKICPAGTEKCEMGDLTDCCLKNPNSQYDPAEVCTKDCGCCDFGVSNCCPGRGFAVCCADSDTCCRGPNFNDPQCCEKNHQCCPDGDYPGCCPPGQAFCCGNDCCDNAGCDHSRGGCFPKPTGKLGDLR